MSFTRTGTMSPRTLEKQCTVHAIVRNFSNTAIHNPSRKTPEEMIDYDVSCCYFEYQYPVTIYPNGHDTSSEGSVSVAFTARTFLKGWKFWYGKLFQMSAVISVIGAEGGTGMFPRSFVVQGDFPKPGADPSFIVGRYISRSALLDKRDELLGSDDTLTLRMDIRLRETQYRVPYENIVKLAEFLCFDISTYFVDSCPIISQGGTVPVTIHSSHLLYLGRSVGKGLRPLELGDYFRSMSVTPLIERYMRNGKSQGSGETGKNCLGENLILVNIPLHDESCDFRTYADLLKESVEDFWKGGFSSVSFEEAIYLHHSLVSSLPYREHPWHVTVGDLLFGGKAVIMIKSLDEILDLYSLTKKCHFVSSVRDSCLRWLRLCLTVESFVGSGLFTWKDYKNIYKIGDHSLREILRSLVDSRYGRKVVGFWITNGPVLDNLNDMALFVIFEEDTQLKKSLEDILKNRDRGVGSDWQDFLSSAGVTSDDKWTCEHVVAGSQSRFLFGYRLDSGEKSEENDDNNETCFDFYS